jgi:hypothetical protein
MFRLPCHSSHGVGARGFPNFAQRVVLQDHDVRQLSALSDARTNVYKFRKASVTFHPYTARVVPIAPCPTRPLRSRSTTKANADLACRSPSTALAHAGARHALRRRPHGMLHSPRAESTAQNTPLAPSARSVHTK